MSESHLANDDDRNRVLRESGKSAMPPMRHEDLKRLLENAGVKIDREPAEPTLIGESVIQIVNRVVEQSKAAMPSYVGTPKDIPSQFELLWSDGAAAGGITRASVQEAVSAFNGTLITAPNSCDFTVTVDNSSLVDTIRERLQKYVGLTLTPQVFDTIASDLRELLAQPPTVGHDHTQYLKDRAAEEAFQAMLQADLAKQETFKMREDAFHRRIMPPVAITNDELDRATPPNGYATWAAFQAGEAQLKRPDPKNPKYDNKVNEFCKDMRRWEAMQPRPFPADIPNDELDRSVPTNLPVDLTHDTPYQAFRRERNLPDTPDSRQTWLNLSAAAAVAPNRVSDDAREIAATARSIQDMLRNPAVGWPYPPTPVRPEPVLQEFFAYETVGATISHAASVVKTDDPALMKALGDAIDQGRVEMDGDVIVSIDGVSMDSKTTFENDDLNPIIVEGKT